MPGGVETKLTSVPEEMVRAAPSGAAFVVLTHDHALDCMIVAEALKRTDAAYVGMIGSKTKRATFRSWFLKTAGGTEDDCRRLLEQSSGYAGAMEPSFLEPVSNRGFLARILNNLKTIHLNAQDYPRALAVVERLALLHPDDARELRLRDALRQVTSQ